MRRRNKKRKVNIFKILSILLVILFILFTPKFIQKLIKINKIICLTQYGSCTQEFTLSDYKTTKNNIERTLKQDIQVSNFLIQYKIPNILKVDINLKKPKYAILTKDNIYYLIDKEGLILKEALESNLPTLINNNLNLNIGNNISETQMFALKIIEKVAWLYSVKTGNLESSELTMRLKEGILVHFSLEGDIDTLVGSLRLIFSRLNDEGEGIKMSDIREIDLRYKNAILR